MTDLLYTTPSITSFISYMTYLNTITGNLFWTFASVSFLVVLYVAMSTFKFKHALVASLFIAFTLTVFLRMAGLVGDFLVGLYIICLAFAGLYAYSTRDTT